MLFFSMTIVIIRQNTIAKKYDLSRFGEARPILISRWRFKYRIFVVAYVLRAWRANAACFSDVLVIIPEDAARRQRAVKRVGGNKWRSVVVASIDFKLARRHDATQSGPIVSESIEHRKKKKTSRPDCQSRSRPPSIDEEFTPGGKDQTRRVLSLLHVARTVVHLVLTLIIQLRRLYAANSENGSLPEIQW